MPSLMTLSGCDSKRMRWGAKNIEMYGVRDAHLFCICIGALLLRERGAHGAPYDLADFFAWVALRVCTSG